MQGSPLSPSWTHQLYPFDSPSMQRFGVLRGWGRAGLGSVGAQQVLGHTIVTYMCCALSPGPSRCGQGHEKRKKGNVWGCIVVAFEGCNPIYGPQYATISSKYPFCYNGFGASL